MRLASSSFSNSHERVMYLAYLTSVKAFSPSAGASCAMVVASATDVKSTSASASIGTFTVKPLPGILRTPNFGASIISSRRAMMYCACVVGTT